MNATTEPLLAPPGAGLPALEHLAARLLFEIKCRTGNRKAFTEKIEHERQRIRLLLRRCTPESGALRVLIRRPIGLEDSSRYWSVWMTLDHLRIVHHQFIHVINTLADERIPQGKASTAAVKPNPTADGRVEPAYEESCDLLLAATAAINDLNTRACFAHPWFGPLNASGWHALAGMHMAIHRVQIERIIAGTTTS